MTGIENLPPADGRRNRVVWLWVAMGLYAVLSATMAVRSSGFMEADGITHFLARRFALSQPLHFVDVWSRPLCVLLYCVPARLGGLVGTRLMSLVLVLVAVPLVMACAARLGLRRPGLAGLFLLTQPLLFAHSFSELTEVPFALLLLAMFYAYQRRWFGVIAVLAAVSPLGRPEGFGLLGVVAVALALHRRWGWIAVLPVGLLVWQWCGWHVFGGPANYPWWDWLRHNWPYSPTSVYGHGSPFWLTAVLPAVIGPVAFGFAAFGVFALLRGVRWRELTRQHELRCRAVAVAVPLGVLAGHSVLWATGKMASNGEPRYLLVAAPFWAVLAAAGLERLAAAFAWRRPGVFVVANAACALLANAVYPCFPLKAQDDDRLAEAAVRWIDDRPELRRDYPRLMAWLPHIFYRLDIDKLGDRSPESTKEGVAAAADGTLLIWDSIYGLYNSDANYVVPERLIRDAGWRPVAELNEHGHRLLMFVSPRPRTGTAASQPGEHFPIAPAAEDRAGREPQHLEP